MNIIETAIPDVKIIEPKVFGDHRGFFMETWNQKVFQDAGITAEFVQDNHSKSAHGILRGLHYQLQQTQGKLVRVTSGEVFDVAVDIRRSSPTYGKWVSVLLNDENKRMLWIPSGFAHGFYVTTSSAEFLYKCTDFWAPQYERSLLWNDPQLNIPWPLVDQQEPILSEKDKNGALLSEAEVFP